MIYKSKEQSTILLLGFLVVLALLVVVLWTLNRVQEIKPSPYIDQFRAKVLAQTGIERALSEFRNNPHLYFIKDTNAPWLYWGEDLNRNYQLDTDEDQNNNNKLDIIECPGEQALYPSFASGALQKINGQNIGFSGIIPRAQDKSGDLYILKIIDTSSQIYINNDNNGTVQLLNNLGRILGINEKLGNQIHQARLKLDNSSFIVKEELKEIIGEKKYRKIKPYITVWGVPNTKTVKPKPFRKRPGYTGEDQDIISLSQINSGLLETEQRVPININTAPKPILMSVLLNLSGCYIGQAEVSNPILQNTTQGHFSYDEGPKLRIGVIKKANIDYNLSERFANLIIKERQKKPFLSWQDFNEFCKRLLKKGVFGPTDTPLNLETAQAKVDLIKANVNPNTCLNDFNPNKLTSRLIDKSDLSVYTTEFCFQPQGYFEIESTGIVTRPSLKVAGLSGSATDGRNVTGLKKIRHIVKFFEMHHETNQKDFSKGTISKSYKTDFTHKNKTLQSYPEPKIQDYTQSCIADGQIMKATKQNHSQNKKENILLTFQNHFQDNLKADYSTGNPLIAEGNANENSLFDENQGIIYPDGVYSEFMSYPCYNAENNFVDAFAHEKLFGEKRFRGTITFWAKPNYFMNSSKPRILFNISKKTEYPQSHEDIFSLLLFPKYYQSDIWNEMTIMPLPSIVWFWDLAKNKSSIPSEYVHSHNINADNRSEWFHVGIAWDTKPTPKTWNYSCPNCKGTGKVMLMEYEIICSRCKGNGVLKETKISSGNIFTFCINGKDTSKYIGLSMAKYPPYINNHIDFSKDSLIKLGESPEASFWNMPADTTFDELTIQIHETTSKAKEFIINEYKEGRYYKGEGVFTSGKINPTHFYRPKTPSHQAIETKDSDTPDTPSYLQCRADWTAYYPADSTPIEIQFFDERDNPISKPLSYPENNYFTIPLNPNLSKNIKYKVFFRKERENSSAPMLETPVFDDITITFIKNKPEIYESYWIPQQ